MKAVDKGAIELELFVKEICLEIELLEGIKLSVSLIADLIWYKSVLILSSIWYFFRWGFWIRYWDDVECKFVFSCLVS